MIGFLPVPWSMKELKIRTQEWLKSIEIVNGILMGKKKERKKLRKSVRTQYDSVFAVHPWRKYCTWVWDHVQHLKSRPVLLDKPITVHLLACWLITATVAVSPAPCDYWAGCSEPHCRWVHKRTLITAHAGWLAKLAQPASIVSI